MKKQLAMLTLFAVSVFSQPLSSEVFSTLDREVAGLMDAWVIITEERNGGSAGLFMAGTAILRAEAAYEAAVHCSREYLPREVVDSWVIYLKASADCIDQFQKAVRLYGTADKEEILLAAFSRWETRGREFLESVQTTR
ncbi:MAG: hypothetical protein KAH54_11570 [Candidatus Sabulitectum sp.]|nr:hypothetical protein [Candidatus Sabulitectum sp.]